MTTNQLVECQACYEEFNDKYYKCSSCGVVYCYSCMKEILLKHQHDIKPHCPDCLNRLTYMEVYNIVENDFPAFLNKVSTLKFILEKARIPECMECCKALKAARRFTGVSKDLLNIMKNIADTIKSSNDEIVSEDLSPVIESQVYDLAILIIESQNKKDTNIVLKLIKHYVKTKLINKSNGINIINGIISHLNSKLNINAPSINSFDELLVEKEDNILKKWDEKVRNAEVGRAGVLPYLFKCSYEKCRGYVNKEYICELCGHRYCPKCLVDITTTNKNNVHVCKKEDIEAVNTIEKETKPCPKCFARVYKSEGCNQMFCTHCHCGFDYATGNIIQGNFHNPERTEWLNKNPKDRKARDIVDINNIKDPYCTTLFYRLRQIQWLKNAVVDNLENKMNYNITGLFRKRCDYVLKNVSEDDYYAFIWENEKERCKSAFQFQILNDYINKSLEIIERARKKDDTYLESANFTLKMDAYFFLNGNNIVGLVKKCINEGKTKEECVNTIKILFDEKTARREPLIITPPSLPMERLIDAIYENKDVLPLIDTFDDEIDEIEKLLEKTNNDLMILKEIFKDKEVIQLSRKGSPFATYFTKPIPGSLNCAKDKDVLSYKF